jgi:hypothetical protein
MRTATFPAVRTTPEDRALVESVLRPGETLSTFIEETVLQKAQLRKEDEAFYARAMEASERIRAGGKTYTLDETIASLRKQIQNAREKQAAPDAPPLDVTGSKKTVAKTKKTKAAA